METLQQLKDKLYQDGEALTHRCDGECKKCGYFKPDNKLLAEYGYCLGGYNLAKLQTKIKKLEKIKELKTQ